MTTQPWFPNPAFTYRLLELTLEPKVCREPAAGCRNAVWRWSPRVPPERLLCRAPTGRARHKRPLPNPLCLPENKTIPTLRAQYLLTLRGATASLLGFLTAMKGSWRWGPRPVQGWALPSCSSPPPRPPWWPLLGPQPLWRLPYPLGAIHAPVW